MPIYIFFIDNNYENIRISLHFLENSGPMAPPSLNVHLSLTKTAAIYFKYKILKGFTSVIKLVFQRSILIVR